MDRYYNELWEMSPMSRIGCGTPVFAAIFVMLFLLLSSCATKTKVEYVDREVIKYQKEVIHDTLLQDTHDSIFVNVFQRGDTVFSTKYIEKTKYRDRVVTITDTCYRDSIQTQINEVVKVEEQTPTWCYYCLGLCVLFILFLIYRVVKWLQIH